jgi:hypothetical protein
MTEPNEDDIGRWIEEIDNRGINKQAKVEGNVVSRWWNNFKFEIGWNFNHYISSPIRNFRTGINNLIKYRKLIWNDRWWDYSFFMRMLEFKLKDTEKHWGRDTHYVGDQDEKDTLKKLIEDLEWLNNNDLEFTKDYEAEYKKRSRSFFGRLDRNHRKFWD